MRTCKRHPVILAGSNGSYGDTGKLSIVAFACKSANQLPASVVTIDLDAFDLKNEIHGSVAGFAAGHGDAAVARNDSPARGSGWIIRGAWRDGLS